VSETLAQLRRAAAGEAGMSIVEAMVAAALLLTGIVATFTVLDGSRKLVTASERTEAAVHRGQQQLERAKAIAFDSLELSAAPGPPTGADDPRAAVVAGTPPRYDWDQASGTNATEPLDIKAVGVANADALAPRESFDDGRISGTVDTFVTEVSAGLKRVTVAVWLNGDRPPRRPVLGSTLVSPQGTGATP
jgi:hypothetical protein